MLKTADIGHAAKEWQLHEEWSTRITEEFHMQGDIEKGLKMKISPLCDRESSNLANSQVGFINFLVLPLFETSAKFFDAETKEHDDIVYMKNILDNKARWTNMTSNESKRISKAGHRNSEGSIPGRRSPSAKLLEEEKGKATERKAEAVK